MSDKGKNKRENREMKIRIVFLRIFVFLSPYRWITDVVTAVIGGLLQWRYSSRITNLLSAGMYGYLKNPSLVLGMTSTIGLSMIVVFGFNFSKSVQQDYLGELKERGIENTKQAKKLEIKINYWQMLLLILLYICIVMDWFTFFYVLFAYDVFCYVTLIIKLWMIKSAGVDYILKNYREMDQQRKKDEIDSILQNCVENDRDINARAINAYIEWLFIYLQEKKVTNDDDRYYEEKFYDEANQIFTDSMDKLVLEKRVQSSLLILVIRQFSKDWYGKEADKIEYSLFFAVLLTYALDREKNIDTDFIYKEIIGWNDKSVELRYCIAVSRLEYLNAVAKEKGKVLLSDNIFYLYRPMTVTRRYKDLIYLLWYLWTREDGQYLTVYAEDMNKFVGFFHGETNISNMGDTANSLYMSVSGLKY